MHTETAYQLKLITKIKQLMPNCFIIKSDRRECQGMPDLLILSGEQWAMLEVKVSENAPQQPNQPYYVEMFNDMSFAAFIYPENEEDVLHALQSAFGFSG